MNNRKNPLRAVTVGWLLMLSNVGFAQPANPPTVEVRVEIKSKRLVTGLTQIGIHDVIEFELSRILAKSCQNHYGFLNWTQNDPGSQRVLVVRIDDNPDSGSILLPETHISYHVEGQGELTQVNSFLRDEHDASMNRVLAIVFPGNKLIPSYDGDHVRRAIKKSMSKQLDNKEFRRVLQKHFLATIPLVHSVHVDSAGQRIMIPIDADKIRARDDDTSFLVKIESSVAAGGPAVEGTLSLVKNGSRASSTDNTRRDVQCIFKNMKFPANDLDRFDPIVETIIRNALQIHVFMNSYSPTPGTQGTLVTDV